MSEIIISDKHEELTVSSLDVARDFRKAHDKVVRDIKNLIRQNWRLKKWFFESTYITPRGRHYQCYEIPRDGFALLAMGSTGEKALEWKVKYIEAFNEMEQKLLTNQQKHDRISKRTNVLFDWDENISASDFGDTSNIHLLQPTPQERAMQKALALADYSIAQLSALVKYLLQKTSRNEEIIMQYGNIELDTLKSYLPQYLATITQHRQGKQYNCPFCGSGTGKKGTPALSTYENDTKWKCQSCGAGGDIIDLFLMHHQLMNSVDNFKYAVKILSEEFHIHSNSSETPHQTEKRTHIYTTDTGKNFAMKTIISMSDGSKKCFWNLFDPSTQQFSITGLQKQTAPLYQVQNLAKSKGVIYFTEGEKDAELLMKWGYTATCTPNGAGQSTWHEEYNRYLKDCDIVILTDNDQSGEKYGRFIGNHVYQTAKSVKVVPASAIYSLCPKKGDISDISGILGEETAKQALEKIIGQTQLYQPDMTETPEKTNSSSYIYVLASDVQQTPLEFVWYPYIPIGEITIMYASGGTGKSFLTCGIAASITTGISLPQPDEEPIQTTPENVLFISAEDSRNILAQRLKAAGADTNRCILVAPPDTEQELASYQSFEFPHDSHDVARIEALKALIRETKAKLIIIDPWSAYIGREKDMNKANDVRAVTAVLTVIAKQFHCAFLIVAHTNKKPQADNANDAVSGSVDLVNGARSALAIRTFGTTDRRIMVQTKCNYSALGKSVCYQIVNQGRNQTAKFEWDGFSDITKEDLETSARTGKKLSDVLNEKADKAKQQEMAIETIIRLSEFGKKIPISFQRFREEIISDYGEDFLPSHPAIFVNELITDLRTRGMTIEDSGKVMKCKLSDGTSETTAKRGFILCCMTDGHLMAEAMPKK